MINNTHILEEIWNYKLKFYNNNLNNDQEYREMILWMDNIKQSSNYLCFLKYINTIINNNVGIAKKNLSMLSWFAKNVLKNEEKSQEIKEDSEKVYEVLEFKYNDLAIENYRWHLEVPTISDPTLAPVVPSEISYLKSPKIKNEKQISFNILLFFIKKTKQVSHYCIVNDSS